jgi:FKBP-type peptidyl-prolyl cis-trans isomerase (trigger factor)
MHKDSFCVPAEAVKAEFAAVAKEFASQVQIGGFRKGKPPFLWFLPDMAQNLQKMWNVPFSAPLQKKFRTHAKSLQIPITNQPL